MSEIFKIKRNNRELKFKIIGEGTPIFIVGFGDYTFKLLSKDLTSKYKFILHNYYGLTQAKDIDEFEFTLPNLLEDIKFIQSFLKLKTMNIFGHSSSGTVALDYTLNNPQLIDKLFMICSPIKFDKEYVKIQQEYKTNYLAGERKAVFDKNMNLFNKKIKQNLVKNFFKEYHEVQTPLYFYNYNFKSPDYWNDIFINQNFIKNFVDRTYEVYKRKKNILEIQTKLISIIGKYDFATPYITWEKYVTLLNVHLFEYSSHYPMIEEKEKFNNIILSYLNE